VAFAIARAGTETCPTADWQMSDGGESRLKLDGCAFSGAGIYFVRLSSGAESRTVKVVKLP